MTKLQLYTLLLSVLVSCNQSNSSQQTEESQNTEIYVDTANIQKDTNEKELETPKKDSLKIESKNKAKLNSSIDLSNEVASFIACKKAAKKPTDCRNNISKIIAETYGITDFDDDTIGYVVYDSIQPIVKRSLTWKNLGSVSQETLNKAEEHTNNGGLSLIINTSSPYGHVVMLVPGESRYSGKWEMNLASVLSLNNHNPEKSFVNKSLAYAFKKSNAVKVFIRE